MERKCSVKDCNSKHYANGMCRKHYAQMKRYGVLSSERRSRVCKIDGCNQLAMLSKEHCKRHHTQVRKGRTAQASIAYCNVFGCNKPREKSTFCLEHYTAIRTTGCLAVDCSDTVYARGYCVRHYYQMKNHGKLLPETLPKKAACSVKECERRAIAKGYCRKHYDVYWRTR